MSGRKKRAEKVLQLPNNIRDELRLTCCLKGYSAIKCGGGKTLPKQEAEIYNFVHGKALNHPSQIKLLSDASYSHRKLFNGESRPATQKNDNHTTVYKYSLIPELSLDMSRNHCQRIFAINSA